MHLIRADLDGTLIAICLFSLVAFVPGYVMSWVANVLDFRSQTAGWRFVISVPVSIAICPLLAYWVDGLADRAAVWTLFALCWLAFAVLFVAAISNRQIVFHLPSRMTVAFAFILILWIALVLGSALDLQFGDRLYASVTSADQAFRVALTDAITRTGIAHPKNPYYYVDGPAAVRYHYFWFILCSLVDQLVGAAVSARNAFIASIVWSGIALGCTIAAFLRFFAPQSTANIKRRALTGILLLAVTGLDIIPTLALFHQHILYMDMEWWNEAITSWAGSLIWVPHHVGGLVSGLIAFLILWHAASSSQPRWKWMATLVAGMALATMLGDSIYVGLVFAVFLSLWTALTFLAGWRNHTAVLVAAGLVTVLLAFPYLRSLAGPAAGGAFIQFTVRNFKGATAFRLNTEFNEPWKTYLARLALLPLNYFIELGFFLIVGILQMARLWSLRRIKPDAVAGVTMVLTSFAICTFFKSGVISNNDLGWRGFLPAQFMLLIWAVEFVPAPTQPWAGIKRTGRGGVLVGECENDAAAFRCARFNEKSWLYTHLSPVLPLLLVIGVVSTAYSLGVLRFAEIGYDQGPEYAVGKRTYAARQVYERLREILPVTAIVQENPDQENLIYYGLYSNRQMAVGGPTCGSEFGGSLQACHQVYPAVSALFSARGAGVEDAEEACRKLKIDALIVTSGDPVWKAADSWVWKMRPSITTDFARAFVMTSSPQIRQGAAGVQ